MLNRVLAVVFGVAVFITPAVADEGMCPHSISMSIQTKQEVYNKADKAHVYDTPERIAMLARAFEKVTGKKFTDDKETLLAFIQVSMEVWVAVGFRGDCMLGTFRIYNRAYSAMLKAMEFEKVKYED